MTLKMNGTMFKPCNRVKYIGLVIIGFLTIGGCNETPLLTDMETTRLLVVLKGTYESNTPRPWDNSLTPDDPSITSKTVKDIKISGQDLKPSTLMLDLAQMKLATTNKFHVFSPYRQTYLAGLNDGDPLFNGAGLILQNDDVPPASYLAIGLYMRKMLFDNGTRYIMGSAGWSILPAMDVFAEQLVPGVNFNQYMLNGYFDSLRIEGYQINRVFPITVGIEPFMYFNSAFPYTVLEIRMVIKNFIKKFEVDSYDQNGFFTVTHFWAPSDWRMPLYEDDTQLGGNLITTARWYVPGLTGTIRGTCPAGYYILAIPAGESITRYAVPNEIVDNAGNDRRGSMLTGSSVTAYCDMKKTPGFYFGSLVGPYIDNCIKAEQWKVNWNNRITGTAPCTDYGLYQTAWDNYVANTSIKMAPLATYAASTQFTLDNVMPGNYDIYVFDATTVPYGTLFTYNAAAPPSSSATVTVGAGSVVSISL